MSRPNRQKPHNKGKKNDSVALHLDELCLPLYSVTLLYFQTATQHLKTVAITQLMRRPCKVNCQILSRLSDYLVVWGKCLYDSTYSMYIVHRSNPRLQLSVNNTISMFLNVHKNAL